MNTFIHCQVLHISHQKLNSLFWAITTSSLQSIPTLPINKQDQLFPLGPHCGVTNPAAADTTWEDQQVI